MASQALAARPESHTVPIIYPENAKPPPWYETPNPHPGADLNLHTPQATGRDKAMNIDSQDKVNDVIDKLELMHNIFSFYWFAIDKVDFNKDSLNGLNRIIGECIEELKEAMK